MTSKIMNMELSKGLLSILVCPQCRGALEASSESLYCPKDDTHYPVVDGTPYLVPECAIKSRVGARGMAEKRVLANKSGPADD